MAELGHVLDRHGIAATAPPSSRAESGRDGSIWPPRAQRLGATASTFYARDVSQVLGTELRLILALALGHRS